MPLISVTPEQIIAAMLEPSHKATPARANNTPGPVQDSPVTVQRPSEGEILIAPPVVKSEIERKWLVVRGPAMFAPLPERGEVIRQGYLAIGPDAEHRVRQIGNRFCETRKSGSGLSRTESEREISQAEFQLLAAQVPESNWIQKVRYPVPVPSGAQDQPAVMGELDVYMGKLNGLCVLEIEFPSEEVARAFVPPAWLTPEVTGDKRFSNARLAQDGLIGLKRAAGSPI